MSGYRPKRPKNHVTWSTCRYCGKRAYPSRKTARRAAQTVPGGTMNAYPCPQVPAGFDPVWHLGHLPDPVAAGRWPRAALGAPKRRPAEHQHRDGVFCPSCQARPWQRAGATS